MDEENKITGGNLLKHEITQRYVISTEKDTMTINYVKNVIEDEFLELLPQGMFVSSSNSDIMGFILTPTSLDYSFVINESEFYGDTVIEVSITGYQLETQHTIKSKTFRVRYATGLKGALDEASLDKFKVDIKAFFVSSLVTFYTKLLESK